MSVARMTEAQLQAHQSKQGGGRNTPKKPVFRIGIDPGKNTGFAVWSDQAKEFSILETITPQAALKKASAFDRENTLVVIEVPKTKANFHAGNSHTQSVNIGMVLGQARLMADYLKAEGYTVIEKHPRGKVDAAGFKRLTGYQGRTNEHNRDAGMLAMVGK